MKVCTKCEIPKLESEFNKDKSRKSGLCSRCKICRSKYEKDRYANKGGKERHVLISREYRKNNKEKCALINKEWHKNNKERATLTGKEWRKNNPEKAGANSKKYNLRRKRELGFNPLNDKFLGSVAHHVNKNDVVYIKESTHKSVPHSLKTGYNMDVINKLAFVSCVSLTGQIVGGVRVNA